MKKVAFICVHNSCRSQIAEALGKYYASDVFESYSAGTELKNSINPDAVRLMKEIYDIDNSRLIVFVKSRPFICFLSYCLQSVFYE